MVICWRLPSWINRKIILSNFTMQNNFFTITLRRKCTFNNFTLQQFVLLLELCVKRSDQTVHVFLLRFGRLLEGPKRPIETESILGKTPYRGASRKLEHNGAPGSASENLPNFEGKTMVCKLSVKSHLDERLFLRLILVKLSLI